MKLINEYLNQVSYYLTLKERKEIINELRSEIENRIGANYTDEDVKVVLNELGNPRLLAREYTPDVEGLYISFTNLANFKFVLRILVIIGLIAIPINGIIEFTQGDLSWVAMIFICLHRFFMYFIFSIGILTIIFYFINKFDSNDVVNQSLKEADTWSVDNLYINTYSLKNMIIEGIFFIIGCSFYVGLLTTNYFQTNGLTEYIFFDTNQVQLLLMFLIGTILLFILDSITKYKYSTTSVQFLIITIIKATYEIATSYIIFISKKIIFLPPVISGDINFDLIFVTFAIIITTVIVNCIYVAYKYLMRRQ